MDVEEEEALREADIKKSAVKMQNPHELSSLKASPHSIEHKRNQVLYL